MDPGVYRFRDDRYKFLQTAQFETKMDWERYWSGPEFIDFRVLSSSWFQVPVVYGWSDLVVSGGLAPEPTADDAITEVTAGDLAG